MTAVVDAHSHLFPAAWRPRGRMPDDLFDVEGLLARQNEAGLDASVVSDPHIWYGDLDPCDLERTREYNDFAAGLARDHPGQVRALGTASPFRGEEHVREAERALTELGLSGLALATSDGGRYLDHVPQSFWELVTALDAVTSPHCTPQGTDGRVVSDGCP